MESFHRRPSTSWKSYIAMEWVVKCADNAGWKPFSALLSAKLSKRKSVNSKSFPLLQCSNRVLSLIRLLTKALLIYCLFPSSNPSSLVVLYKPNLSTYIRQVITSCERKPRSAQSIYSNCRTKNRETVIIKMVTTYWKHSNIMRDRVEKREDASSRMELTGLLHVYFKNG